MANTNKITKVDTFKAIKEAFLRRETDTLTIKGEQVSIIDFCNHEIELIQKKASSKKKTDNSAYQSKVIEILREGGKTPSELVSLLDVINTQKVAGVCKPLIENGIIKKEIKGKKVTYFLA